MCFFYVAVVVVVVVDFYWGPARAAPKSVLLAMASALKAPWSGAPVPALPLPQIILSLLPGCPDT